MRQNYSSHMDNRKVILTSYLGAAAILWFLTRACLAYLHLTFYQVRRMPGILTVREVLPLVLAGTLFLILFRHRKVNEVMDEVVAELKKVTWPSRDDVVKSTTVVMICIVIASGIIATFDVIWGRLIGAFL